MSDQEKFKWTLSNLSGNVRMGWVPLDVWTDKLPSWSWFFSLQYNMYMPQDKKNVIQLYVFGFGIAVKY